MILPTLNTTMSSREIAELTGKRHADVMRSIRDMEPAWEKINGRKFALVNYTDEKGEKRPMYQLLKLESFYIGTKFNDEARAKLILRWEELEKKANDFSNPDTVLQLVQNWKKEHDRSLMLEQENELKQMQLVEQNRQIRDATPKVEYHDEVLISQSTYTSTSIAKELGMGAVTLHRKLKEMGIMYKVDSHWVLYHQYQGKGYTKTRTATYDDRYGQKQSTINTVWTEAGREFVHRKLNPLFG